MENIKEKPYVIVRTSSAGVFAGYMELKEGREVMLTNARRIWYWEGAASLSHLAMDGTSKPEKCQFPCPVNKIILLDTVEILFCTTKSLESIASVPIWTR